MYLQSLFSKYRGLLFPLAIIACIGVLLVPLPTAAMDILLAANIAIAVIILLTTISIKTPLEFNVFPSLLVATTLARLVLNVGTTRLILTGGATEGEQAAGGMIQAFGDFVAGDMLIVGVVIFAIIAAIQFLVITKGATRVGEVAARFALDGMPGRQMAIDADLNAGQITGEEAQLRRAELAEQADFYGAMDGASKFVRGDAIAAILITFINLVGGLAVGITSGVSIFESAETFTKLTIGDGLVSQIPAFLISIAAALLVTRNQKSSDLPNELLDQLFSQPQTLAVAGCFLGLLIFTQLPTLPLIALGSACVGLSILLSKTQKKEREAQQEQARQQAARVRPKTDPVNLLHVDPIRIELGAKLIQLADSTRQGDLMERISQVRNQVASEMGFLIPQVRLKDNLSLAPTSYVIHLSGNPIASSDVFPDQLLATGANLGPFLTTGVPCKHPVDGRSSLWIPLEEAERARSAGLQVLAPTTVISAHLDAVCRQNSSELLTREQTNQLIQQLKSTHPAIVEELLPERLTLANIQQVLQQLLSEGIPIRQLAMICEALSDAAQRSRNPHVLTQLVRERLARTITNRFSIRGELRVFTLAPALEDRIAQSVDLTGDQISSSLAPQEITELCNQIHLLTKRASLEHPVVLARPNTRAALRWLTRHRLPSLVALSPSEITLDAQVHSLGVVGAASAAA